MTWGCDEARWGSVQLAKLLDGGGGCSPGEVGSADHGGHDRCGTETNHAGLKVLDARDVGHLRLDLLRAGAARSI